MAVFGVRARPVGPPTTRVERRQRSLAAAWSYNPHLENVARLRDQQPQLYAGLRHGTKTKLGYYLNAKAAAAAQGIDVSPPEQDDG
jgi:hypothetical protein